MINNSCPIVSGKDTDLAKKDVFNSASNKEGSFENREEVNPINNLASDTECSNNKFKILIQLNQKRSDTSSLTCNHVKPQLNQHISNICKSTSLGYSQPAQNYPPSQNCQQPSQNYQLPSQNFLQPSKNGHPESQTFNQQQSKPHQSSQRQSMICSCKPSSLPQPNQSDPSQPSSQASNSQSDYCQSPFISSPPAPGLCQPQSQPQKPISVCQTTSQQGETLNSYQPLAEPHKEPSDSCQPPQQPTNQLPDISQSSKGASNLQSDYCHSPSVSSPPAPGLCQPQSQPEKPTSDCQTSSRQSKALNSRQSLSEPNKLPSDSCQPPQQPANQFPDSNQPSKEASNSQSDYCHSPSISSPPAPGLCQPQSQPQKHTSDCKTSLQQTKPLNSCQPLAEPHKQPSNSYQPSQQPANQLPDCSQSSKEASNSQSDYCHSPSISSPPAPGLCQPQSQPQKPTSDCQTSSRESKALNSCQSLAEPNKQPSDSCQPPKQPANWLPDSSQPSKEASNFQSEYCHCSSISSPSAPVLGHPATQLQKQASDSRSSSQEHKTPSNSYQPPLQTAKQLSDCSQPPQKTCTLQSDGHSASNSLSAPRLHLPICPLGSTQQSSLPGQPNQFLKNPANSTQPSTYNSSQQLTIRSPSRERPQACRCIEQSRGSRSQVSYKFSIDSGPRVNFSTDESSVTPLPRIQSAMGHNLNTHQSFGGGDLNLFSTYGFGYNAVPSSLNQELCQGNTNIQPEVNLCPMQSSQSCNRKDIIDQQQSKFCVTCGVDISNNNSRTNPSSPPSACNSKPMHQASLQSQQSSPSCKSTQSCNKCPANNVQPSILNSSQHPTTAITPNNLSPPQVPSDFTNSKYYKFATDCSPVVDSQNSRNQLSTGHNLNPPKMCGGGNMNSSPTCSSNINGVSPSPNQGNPNYQASFQGKAHLQPQVNSYPVQLSQACSNCGDIVNQQQNTFCVNCGVDIKNGSALPTHSDYKSSQTCINCGDIINQQQNSFCISCGVDINKGDNAVNTLSNYQSSQACSNCGGIIDQQQNTFCINCGVDINKDNALTSLSNPQSSKNCSHCGDIIDQQQNTFCVNCGVDLKNDNSPKPLSNCKSLQANSNFEERTIIDQEQTFCVNCGVNINDHYAKTCEL